MKKIALVIALCLIPTIAFAGSYKIKSTTVKDVTLDVVTEFTFNDGSTKEVSVSCFMPETKTDVISSLENRLISEQRAIDAKARNILIKADIDKDITKDI